MKRRWFLMFMCLALFLSACGPIHEENATQTSERDVPEVQPFSQLPLEHGNDMVEYDPEREIYIACQNQYKDLYTDLAGHGISFMILSKQQLDPEKIQVILPIETEYLYSIGEEKVQSIHIFPSIFFTAMQGSIIRPTRLCSRNIWKMNTCQRRKVPH